MHNIACSLKRTARHSVSTALLLLVTLLICSAPVAWAQTADADAGSRAASTTAPNTTVPSNGPQDAAKSSSTDTSAGMGYGSAEKAGNVVGTIFVWLTVPALVIFGIYKWFKGNRAAPRAPSDSLSKP